jgi:hypothetical protein
MSMLRTTLYLGLCATTVSLAGAEHTYVAARGGGRAVPIVAIQGVCAWPNLTVLPDGVIVATIFNHPSHGTTAGDVECWASQDGGKTWEKRGTPAAHENEHCNRMNVAAGLAKNGDLLVIASGWTGIKPSGEVGQPFRERILPPWVCRSKDGGRTWSVDQEAFPAPWPEAARQPVSPQGICVPFGDILPGEDGMLRVAMYTGARGAGFVFRSADDGKTWAEPVAIADNAVLNEPAIFHLGGAKWLAATRSNGLDLYVSDDDAQTWTHRQKLTGAAQHPGHIMRLTDGRLLLTYGNRLDPKGVDMRLSGDQGHTWTDPVRVADFRGDGGYPSSVQLPDAQVLTAFYGQPYHMGVVVWEPPAEKGDSE